MKYSKSGVWLRILCLLICTLIFFVACDQEETGGRSDDGDLVPVMGKPSNGANKNEGNGRYSKRVALTYDDGPHNVRTKAIVDELDKYGYNATFFVVGNRVDGSAYNGSSALKYAYEKGNEIGIHGYTHEIYYDRCSDSQYKSELEDTRRAIRNVVSDCQVKLMRPVGGNITDARISSCDYAVIMWDVDSEDWNNKYSDASADSRAEEKLERIVNNIKSSVKDGSVILMHDIYESTYEATVVILEWLNEDGYDVVTVSELFGKELSSGRSYSRAPENQSTAWVEQRSREIMWCGGIYNKSDLSYCNIFL